MAIYAIGDIHGCARSLEQLLDLIRFDPSVDRLWCVGDLVNRGPDSLGVLRYLTQLGPAAQIVLGNHDLFLLAAAEGLVALRPKDTIQDILAAEDRTELLAWLRQQPLHHHEGAYFMVHAGLLPQWSIDEAARLAREVEHTLAGPESRLFLQALFQGNTPQWSAALTGYERLAAVTRALTRLRTCTEEGVLSGFSGSPDDAPHGHLPWFRIPSRRNSDHTILFGHWAALGLHIEPNILGLDSGCVWGRQLTAIRLNDRTLFQVEYADDRGRS
ncbi:symmetrical bis(5'-nucleosyl)-tetraphosphatase [Nitrospira lenta]|uniref:bis(5'-nucleosyl)-tetraphosphatase (symmetrical) n=1 Tax=Nitrospira lenta TaxID=1436998 RepID=A0A330L1D6_9BACT|nr:symmetrical bis(5'-nucleosyl)-tetraphosphatase [Nitrospira lenta]SPP63568.1 Bis(5'-nucleosyl)-tetraphosphatase, symmetrical [Nitrospira lenta]